MAEQDIAIKVEGVYKDFKLPHLRKNTIKSIFMGLFDSSGHQKSYESQHALKDISFEIKKGEFFGIVGRNGSGKSTLLKMLAGIYQPSKGSIQVDGKLVPFIELGVGFNPELTGRENVYLNGAILGFNKDQVDAFYDEVVDFAELEKFMDQKLKNYSSGMQVRLAFSMAIRAQADILLIDEVLAVGDADFQRKCFDYFRRLKRDKKTVVFVGHDMNAIREYCNRGILIESGEVITAGASSKIADAYTKMFIDQSKKKKEKEDNSEVDRFGDRQIEIVEVGLEPGKVVSDDNPEITLKTTIQAHVETDDVIVGFKINNAQGNPLIGTNNKILRKEIGKLRKDERLSFEWVLPNIFNEGGYDIDVAVVASDGLTYDWWNGAVSFDVMKLDKTGFLTAPKIELTIKERVDK